MNSKGQVTIPSPLRDKHRLRLGDEVEVVEQDGALRIVRAAGSTSRGQRLVQRMQGRASTSHTTDELLGLLRGE